MVNLIVFETFDDLREFARGDQVKKLILRRHGSLKKYPEILDVPARLTKTDRLFLPSQVLDKHRTGMTEAVAKVRYMRNREKGIRESKRLRFDEVMKKQAAREAAVNKGKVFVNRQRVAEAAAQMSNEDRDRKLGLIAGIGTGVALGTGGAIAYRNRKKSNP
jgi:hypothetical protein